MFTKIFIDNYRCFSSFQLDLPPTVLLLGPNGSGKTTLLHLIESLRSFISEDLSVDELAPAESLTRWDTRDRQKFELVVELDREAYQYDLVVEHTTDRTKRRVLTEELTHEGKRLFLFDENAEAHLFTDDYQEKKSFPFDWSRSSLGLIRPGPENLKLTRFKDWLTHVQLIRTTPAIKGQTTSSKSAVRLNSDLVNFADWLRARFEEGVSQSYEYLSDLKSTLDGLVDLRFVPIGGDLKELKATFEHESGKRRAHSKCDFGFDELSDGQKSLIVLYSLLHYSLGQTGALLIDEPDNFVALNELQPWLNRLEEMMEERGGQVILISHHPELLNTLAGKAGIWLYRDKVGPVRSKPFLELASKVKGALPASEIVARGWTN